MSHLNVYIMNKVRKLLLVCGCFLGSMSLSAEVTSGSDFEILMQKIRQDFSKNPSIDDGESMRMKQIQDWCHCHQIPFKTKFTYRKDFSFRVNLWNLYSYCRFKIERQ